MNTQPVFNNKENVEITSTSGEKFWISRASCVVAEVFLYSSIDKKWFVLLGQRGENTPDYQNYWGLPCGYLDWSESLYEGMLREVWEETGLNIRGLKENVACDVITGIDKEEKGDLWKISDKSKDIKQNITFHFGVVFNWNEKDFPPLSIGNANEGEAIEAKWIELDEALTLDLAFNHTKRLREIVSKDLEAYRLRA